MGPVLRARVSRGSMRPGCKVLADKTNSDNHMELRKGRRNITNLSIPQKSCIYKLGNDVCNQDLPSQDRLALYNFEVDENDPLPKKKRNNRRKMRHRKKTKYTQAATAAREEKRGSSVTVKKKANVSVADTSLKSQGQHNVAQFAPTRSDSVRDFVATGYQGIACVAEGSGLNLSVAESEPSRRSGLLFSPIEKCPLRPSAFVTVGWPARRVEDFTVDNYFGFDEESEDDPHLSPSPVEMAPRSKHASSGQFAVSSTPNLKPSLMRQEATSMKVMHKRAQTIQCTAAPASSADVPDRADVVCDPAPPILFVDSSEPATPFMKPPRRSYERPVRAHRESHSEEDDLHEEETCSSSRKWGKRSRKEEKILRKWAANVSAQFDEIESFELCVE